MARAEATPNLLRDPILYLGIAFLALLLVQWWNSGRIQVFNEKANAWTYGPPPHRGLPFAFTSGEAAEMLTWFFPAWAILLVLRSRLLSRHAARVLLWAIAVNGSLLGLYGILCSAAGWGSIHWIKSTDGDFFASFFYTNHAGAFFLLVFSVTAGLLMREIERSLDGRLRWGRLASLVVIAAVTFLAINMSHSRAAILLAWGFLVGAFAYGVWRTWKAVSLPTRLNVVAASAAVVCLAFFVAARPVRTAFAGGRTSGRSMGIDVGEEGTRRTTQIRRAMRVWRDHAWFGVGGWGYRHLVASYVPESDWGTLWGGQANVHCDPVQFLAEFGVVGSALLTGAVVALVWPVLPARRWARSARRHASEAWPSPLLLLSAAGAGLVFIHSLVDLPFRSPAVMWHWVAILAAAPLASRHERSRHE